VSASRPAGTPAGRRLLSLCLIAAACIAVDVTGHSRPISTHRRSRGSSASEERRSCSTPKGCLRLPVRRGPRLQVTTAGHGDDAAPAALPVFITGHLSDDAEHEHHATPTLSAVVTVASSIDIGSMRLDGAVFCEARQSRLLITVGDRFVIPQTRRGARNDAESKIGRSVGRRQHPAERQRSRVLKGGCG
jgi:hypothetical protein